MTHSCSLGELLDLEAEVLTGYRSELFAWLLDLTGPRTRVVDLGAGTGTGTAALAQHYPQAQVTAVDLDWEMLDRLRAKGLGVTTLQADLDEGWPAVGDVDLVWAANSMHHLADPDRVLRQAYDALGAGGVLVLAELDSFPTFLTGTADEALEQRCHDAVRDLRRHDVPEMGSDWGTRLGAAGFAVEAERVFGVALTAPLPAATGPYARLSLSRVRDGLRGRIGEDDLAALERVVDGIEARADLTVHAERTVWVARRP